MRMISDGVAGWPRVASYMWRWSLLCRTIVGATLVYASLVKAAEPGRTRAPIALSLPGLSSTSVSVIVAILAGLEAFIGISMLVGGGRVRWAACSVCFLVAVTIGLWWMRAGGFAGDCGCSTPLDPVFGRAHEFARNACLCLAAAFAVQECFWRNRSTRHDAIRSLGGS